VAPAGDPHNDGNNSSSEKRQREGGDASDEARGGPRSIQRADQPPEQRDRVESVRRLAKQVVATDSREYDTSSHQRHS
jgi:hypothetical protein